VKFSSRACSSLLKLAQACSSLFKEQAQISWIFEVEKVNAEALSRGGVLKCGVILYTIS
jgi:hypothetical protein